jgi:TetR/AcrR family transcriptional regulator, ethionamide resistance regulator
MANRGRPTTSRQERQVAVRTQLLGAVTALLAGGGTYAELSINEIVAEAGIAKSTFYQYFTGKNDLLRSLLDEFAIAAGAADPWLNFDGPVTLAELDASIQQRTRDFLPYLPLMAAAFDAVYLDAEVREVGAQVMARLDDGIEAHIRQGQKAGWIDPALPPRETASWLNWMLSRGYHQLVLGADAPTTTDLVSGFSQIIWFALYAPAAHQT